MKLKHYKRKNIIITVATCLVLSTLVFGVVSGYYRQLEANKYKSIDDTSTSTEVDNTQDNSKPKTDNIVNTADSSKTDDKTNTNSTTSSSSTNTQKNSQSTYTAPTTSQQPEPQEQVATCNASMKSSYTNLYNANVASENARWSNQINAWNSYASSHGMAFSGYTQSMIDQYKPAHDATLAQYQTQYYQNLASINCN